MYITQKYSGLNRHGEQSAAGYFLILLQPKYDSQKYPQYAPECVCGKTREQHAAESGFPDCPEHGIVGRLRKLDAFDRNSPEYEAERAACEDALKVNGRDRHVSGCAACDAYMTYYSVCRYFRLKHNSHPMRAIVRYVRMKQLGHFMMGTARVQGERLTLSGSYGSDGLPTSVSDSVYDLGTEVPRELVKAWSEGDGWNGAGAEAPAMRAWALEHFFPTPTTNI